jgi:hypothetical protein
MFTLIRKMLRLLEESVIGKAANNICDQTSRDGQSYNGYASMATAEEMEESSTFETFGSIV